MAKHAEAKPKRSMPRKPSISSCKAWNLRQLSSWTRFGGGLTSKGRPGHGYLGRSIGGERTGCRHRGRSTSDGRSSPAPLAGGGILGSFHAKIEAGKALGIYGNETYGNLDIIGVTRRFVQNRTPRTAADGTRGENLPFTCRLPLDAVLKGDSESQNRRKSAKASNPCTYGRL
jgi:hypothetical protein